MYLDGDKVNAGDSVYHLTLGHGTVETVANNVARIRIAKGGGIKNMSDGGYVAGEKVIFWSKPHIIAPLKDNAMVNDGAAAMYKHMLDFMNMWKEKLKEELEEQQDNGCQ